MPKYYRQQRLKIIVVENTDVRNTNTANLIW